MKRNIGRADKEGSLLIVAVALGVAIGWPSAAVRAISCRASTSVRRRPMLKRDELMDGIDPSQLPGW
jgi:hypothetical protein